MREFLRGTAAILVSSWRASPSRLLVSALLLLVGNVSGPLAAVCFGRATEAALAGHARPAMWWAAGVAVLAVAALTMEHFAHIFFFELADLHAIRTEDELGALALGPVGVAHLESPAHADRVALLREEAGSLGDGVQTVLTAGALAVQIALTAVLLGRLEPWLLLLPLFAVPPLLASHRAESLRRRAQLAAAEPTRLSNHLLDLAASVPAAREIRTFGLAGELRRRQRALRGTIDALLYRAELHGLVTRLGGQALFAAGYIGAIMLIARETIAGQRTAGDIAMVVTLAVQTNAQAAGAVRIAQSLQRSAGTMGLVLWLRGHSPRADPAACAPVPPRLTRGIELRGVGFAYPGAQRPVLRDVDLLIPAGHTVAVVGANGAGKSTLVKLLTRLYSPTSGVVLLDGEDLTGIDAERWRRRTAACFQDFVRFDLAVRHTVGLGDVPRMDDDGALAAAVDRAGARPLVDALPDGLATHVGQAYEPDGSDLSGGQWQRLALARAMMRDGPLLTVLDEPTAALDAQAEHDLFARYAAAAARTARATGGITVFVSHRFSTVLTADLIVVLADGRIAECGTHDELVAAGGTYAELFELQARAYR
ncbi:ABC transporter ATP-binding protein [Dactylosporangium sp. CA-139114]|uniref:ABC transporter ATP-binding protein n=1 Tax=Dactylosporangium sp. CA-139114 TaxID=3239931 RepID=UPI003D9674EC